MLFVLVCGYLLSGKSKWMEDIRNYLSEKIERLVYVISDYILKFDKNKVYVGNWCCLNFFDVNLNDN